MSHSVPWCRPELTVRETLDFSARMQGVGARGSEWSYTKTIALHTGLAKRTPACHAAPLLHLCGKEAPSGWSTFVFVDPPALHSMWQQEARWGWSMHSPLELCSCQAPGTAICVRLQVTTPQRAFLIPCLSCQRLRICTERIFYCVHGNTCFWTTQPPAALRKGLSCLLWAA